MLIVYLRLIWIVKERLVKERLWWQASHMYFIITLETLGPENNKFECSLKTKQTISQKHQIKSGSGGYMLLIPMLSKIKASMVYRVCSKQPGLLREKVSQPPHPHPKAKQSKISKQTKTTTHQRSDWLYD